MADLADLSPLLAQGTALRRGTVAELRDEGIVRVALCPPGFGAGTPLLECEVLDPGTSAKVLSTGDAVLVWTGEAPGLPGELGVILGRIGAHEAAVTPVVEPAAFAQRAENVVIEAQGELILRNGQARIRLSADGDVEISCNAFATRSRRLLRLLAPMIKLN